MNLPKNIPAPQAPSISSVLPASLLMSVIGWLGMAALVILSRPTVWPRWLFFFLAVLAFTGAALPLAAYLNRRFPSQPPVTSGILLRQAIWGGIYLPVLAWLQIGRVLTAPLALAIAVGLAIIEWLLRLREKSQWKPQDSSL